MLAFTNSPLKGPRNIWDFTKQRLNILRTFSSWVPLNLLLFCMTLKPQNRKTKLTPA